jgi:hypothetical protein
MKLIDYIDLVRIRFPHINVKETREGYKRTLPNLVQKVALEIFKEGTRSNTKLNILTRQLLIEYDKTNKMTFDE